MRYKLAARLMCHAVLCFCWLVVVPTAIQLPTLPRIPGLELTASAQILREARSPAERVRRFEEQMQRRVTTNRHSVERVKGSLYGYHIEGLRRDGHLDKIRLPETFRSQFAEDDYFKVLPDEPDDYKQMDVEHGENNRLAFERVGGGWLSLSPFKAGAFADLARSGLHTLRVKRLENLEIVSMYPAGSEGGASIWVLTQDDRTATAEIADHIRRSSGVAHEGDDLPADLKALLLESEVPYLRKSDRSANVSGENLQQAMDLGDQPLSAAYTKIFNALPYEQGLASSILELWRMDLDQGRRKEWQDLDSEVSRSAEANNLRLFRARKAEVLNELRMGWSDVVLIVAHSSGGSVYLPGNTGPLSLEEVSRIKRSVPPPRSVVLITCEGGKVNSETASLAEILLQNRLARTVFASHKEVDARLVPGLLREMTVKGVSIRQVLNKYGFQQIAGLLRLRTDALVCVTKISGIVREEG